MKILVKEDTERLDKFLSKEMNLTRAKIQKLNTSEHIQVNGKIVKNNYKLQIGDCIDISLEKEDEYEIAPEEIDLDIVYEDDYLIVINKKNGMVVHPAPGHRTGTLVNALMFYSNKLSSVGGKFRPGIVHRIDKNTTGLLIIAKNNEVHHLLSEQIKDKKVSRKYLAIVHGEINEKKGIIRAPIGRNIVNRKIMMVTDKNSKFSETHFDLKKVSKGYSLIECSLLTGRTHQIRVHLKYIGYPVLGDPEYGQKKDDNSYGQYLHAYKLDFIHPITHKQISLEAKPPDFFENKLKELHLI